jgi:F-type H+-transporting ATPase subunit b
MIFLGFAENSIQLVPDGTLFLHIAIILVMVFVLDHTLFKPINRILAEREKRTRGRSGEARETLLRVEESTAKYEHTLREARSEGYRLMEQVHEEAMGERQNVLNAIREEVDRLIAKEREAIAAQTEEARAALGRDALHRGKEIGERILHRPLSEAATTGLGSPA